MGRICVEDVLGGIGVRRCIDLLRCVRCAQIPSLPSVAVLFNCIAPWLARPRREFGKRTCVLALLILSVYGKPISVSEAEVSTNDRINVVCAYFSM